MSTPVWQAPEPDARPAPGMSFASPGSRLIAYILDGVIQFLIVAAGDPRHRPRGDLLRPGRHPRDRDHRRVAWVFPVLLGARWTDARDERDEDQGRARFGRRSDHVGVRDPARDRPLDRPRR